MISNTGHMEPLLRIVTSCAVALGLSIGLHAQLIVNQTQPPTTLVQNVLLGSGVFASNVTFNGYPGGSIPAGEEGGRFARFNGSSSNVGLAGGILLFTGDATYAIGPNDEEIVGAGGFPFNATPDLDLSQISGYDFWQVSGGNNVYNKSILEFDFIPMFDMVSFRYVFSSEEYERWTCLDYNDSFGFFLSGPDISGPFQNNAINLATVPGSLAPVGVNSVNSGMVPNNANGGNALDPFAGCFAADPNWMNNTEYYIYNGSWVQGLQGGAQTEPPYCCDPYYIQANGLTVVLQATAAVQCGQQYHMKLAIGNVGDWRVPSGVFIEQGSFTSSDRFDMDVAPGPNVEFTANDTTFIESDCDSVYLRFHRLGGFYLDEDLQITVAGTSTAGVDYAPVLPTQIHFNQFDSTVVVPIAVPVDVDGPEDLIVTLVTCDGLKLQTYVYLIDQREPLVVELDDVLLTCPATVTLTPTVTGGSGDPAALTYLWNTGETTPSITAEVELTTQFWVTVSDSCWALDVTDSAWVTIPDYVPMTLTLTTDTAIPCLGTAELEVEVEGGVGLYGYEWTLEDAVQGTDPTLEVPAAPVPVYYVVSVTDECERTVSDSVLVSQAPPVPLVLLVTPDTAIACLGSAELEAEVTGGGGVISYEWTHVGEVVGTTPTITVQAAEFEVYTVEVSDQCGQVQTANVEVTTGPTPPLVLVAEGDTVLCPNMPLTLQVITVSGGGGAYAYAWAPAGVGPSNGPSLDVQVENDAFFTITITDECGNSIDTTLVAVVTDHDPLSIIHSNDTIVCPGEFVPLWVEVTGGAGGYVVEWPGIGSGEAVVWQATNDPMGAVVNVTDVCGATISGLVEVDVYPAQAVIEPAQLSESTWRFRARTLPETGVDLEWDLGDGTTESGQVEITHTYSDVEAHLVYLFIVTPEGCTAVDSVWTVPPAATIYFPNAFTPNGDGINDDFGGEGRLVDRYELYIFDRWGELIFESKDLPVRWDGTMDGEDVMDGVYQYKYIAKGLKMPLKLGFGHVTLLR